MARPKRTRERSKCHAGHSMRKKENQYWFKVTVRGEKRDYMACKECKYLQNLRTYLEKKKAKRKL